MKYVQNERGNGLVYMLWIMVSSIAIVVIVLNIAKVYAVKQQASNATQLAALAGTSVLVNAGKDAIVAFDDLINLEIAPPDVIDQLLADGGKSVEFLVDKKASEYRNQGLTKDIAYINAMNDILPSRMASYSLLDSLVKSHVGGVQAAFGQTIRDVVEKNGGNIERIEVTFTSDFRVKVEADVTYESITDSAEEFIKSMTQEIPQKGYGPPLKFVDGG